MTEVIRPPIEMSSKVFDSAVKHSQNNWKHLFALPIPRSMIYAAKQTAGLILVGISFLALVGYTFLTEIGLALLKPASNESRRLNPRMSLFPSSSDFFFKDFSIIFPEL